MVRPAPWTVPRRAARRLIAALAGAALLLPPAAPAQPPWAALIQQRGEPLSGGLLRGSAWLPLERAAGGDTPVLSFRSAVVSAGRPAGRVRLLLDTGASASMVTPELATRLGLVSRPLPPGVLGLAGGGTGCAALAPQRTRLPDLLLEAPAGAPAGTIGRQGSDLRLQGLEALVLPVAALPRGIDGVLGAPTLRQLPLLVDPRRSLLVIGSPAPAAFAPAAPASPPAQRLPLRWRHGVPLLRLASAGGAVEALVDTGAEGLFLSPALAGRLQPLGEARPLRLVGICGDQIVQRRRFRGLGLPVPGGAGQATPRSPLPADNGKAVEGIVTDNPLFSALAVEAIVGQEWLRDRSQLWRLDQEPPLLLLR